MITTTKGTKMSKTKQDTPVKRITVKIETEYAAHLFDASSTMSDEELKFKAATDFIQDIKRDVENNFLHKNVQISIKN